MKNIFIALITLLFLSSCVNPADRQQKSDSGVTKATVKLKRSGDGLTTEQRNISQKLVKDNEVGGVKHLYIISSYTGDVLEYSTVKGKITSGGKRLSPKTVDTSAGISGGYGETNIVSINGRDYYTDEVLDDSGAYGESSNYFYWFDAQDNYHQYFPSGGTYVHISNRPLRVKKANFTFE